MADQSTEEALVALQTQHNELKRVVERLVAAEDTSSLAARVRQAEDMLSEVGDLFADIQLGVFRTDKLSTVKAVKAAVVVIRARRKDDEAQG